MKTYIISVILIVGIFYILYTLIQILPHYLHNNNKNNKNNKNTENQNTENNNKNTENNNKNIINTNNIVDGFETSQVLDSLEHGFHDNFATKNGFINNKLLGWRYWYLKNKTDYNVKPTGNFDDIPTRAYLNSMESTNNWFSNLYSMDIEDQIIE
jgi:hypothetical protein